jgi:hypothetical protein
MDDTEDQDGRTSMDMVVNERNVENKGVQLPEANSDGN